MEKLIKVVVFHVDIPENRNMEHRKISSDKFSFELGEKFCEWKVKCYLNRKFCILWESSLLNNLLFKIDFQQILQVKMVKMTLMFT